MGAVSERHAGVASGINNAVSRTPVPLAVAIFGVLMLTGFRSDLTKRLRTMAVSSEVRAELVAQSGDLVSLKIPYDVSIETEAVIRQAVRESFVAGFRRAALAASGLAAAGAIASWLLIAGRPRSETKTAPDLEAAGSRTE
jgi:hypothetical protein